MLRLMRRSLRNITQQTCVATMKVCTNGLKPSWIISPANLYRLTCPWTYRPRHFNGESGKRYSPSRTATRQPTAKSLTPSANLTRAALWLEPVRLTQCHSWFHVTGSLVKMANYTATAGAREERKLYCCLSRRLVMKTNARTILQSPATVSVSNLLFSHGLVVTLSVIWGLAFVQEY
jgi:hypothetical protein